MNTVPHMATRERRSLTPAEQGAAQSLAAAMRHADLNAEVLAPLLGVTAGAVRHWANGTLPVPLAQAGKLSALLNVGPAEICAAWREQVEPYVTGASQPARFTDEIMASAVELLHLMADARPDDARFRRISWGTIRVAAKVVAAHQDDPRQAVAGILTELERTHV